MNKEYGDLDLDYEEKKLLKKLKNIQNAKMNKQKNTISDDFDISSNDQVSDTNDYVDDLKDIISDPSPHNIANKVVQRIVRNPNECRCGDDLLKGVIIGGIGGYIIREIMNKYQ